MMRSICREIATIPAINRPREKFKYGGAGCLGDLELLAVIIGSGTKNNGVMRIAEELLNLFDSLGIPETEKLMAVRGIGEKKAALISAAFEFARRRLCPERKRIACPQDLLPYINHYADRKQEYFLSASLNGAHEIIDIRVVSMGILNRTIVHPREVFADPIQKRAASIIIAHNHPSGSTDPSPEDKEITRRLKEAGETLGIPVLDHLIFGIRGYFSFKEQELM